MRSDDPRWIKTVYGLVVTGGGWAAWHWLGLNRWAAFGVALLGAGATAFLLLGIRDTWPLAVPGDLRDDVARYRAEGWRLARVHPWWHCELSRPHVHMVNPRAARIAREKVIREPASPLTG
jgi:hypothetical protein